MHEASKLSEIADARIDELQAEGLALTPAEIVRINALCWNLESPEMRLHLSKGLPVSVGGVTLWPFTLRSYHWHRQVARSMPTTWHGNVALAYAFAHGYSDGSELDAYGMRAVAAVTAWGVRLRCRMDTLIEAMSQIIQQDEYPSGVENPDSKPCGIGDIAAQIASHTGQRVEDIERAMSMNHALKLLHYTIRTQEQAIGGKPQMSQEAIRATQALELYIEEIRKERITNG
jgi:hypothetical protein